MKAGEGIYLQAGIPFLNLLFKVPHLKQRTMCTSVSCGLTAVNFFVMSDSFMWSFAFLAAYL